MKDVMRPALALFLVAPLTLIGQTTTNADPSQVTKTYEELVKEIDNYYNEQFPEQANSLEGMGAGQESVNEGLDEYNLNNELRDMSDAGEQDIEEELYVLPDEQANSLEDMGAGQESVNERLDEYNLNNELGDISDASNLDTDEELYVLPEFVVSNDQDEGYYSANSTSVTRTNTLVKNSPISMSIVNEQLLDDLNILNTQDLAMVSAAIDEDPNGFSLDRIRIRGFRNSFSRFNFFKRNLPTDSYNIGRVDIIKGANSLIFGQASPGGSISNAPMLANFRDNTKAISAAVGAKDYLRTTFNANQIINDNFAVRVMGVHSEQGYDHPLKSNELDAWTVATTMRFTPKTQLRLHFEGVSATNRFPNRAMRDKTEIDDDNDQNNGYQGILSQADFSSSISNYEVPFSPDWVEHLPEQALDWIIRHTVNNADPVTSREDLRNHYALVNSENYGSVSGPDRFNDRDGIFFMADYTAEINENLQLNLSMNVEQLGAKALGRDSDGAIRVRDSYDTKLFGNNPIRPNIEVVGEQFIRTYWTKNDINTDRNSLRTSLVFENDWLNAKNRIILGFDLNNQTKKERFYDQVPEGAVGDGTGNLPVGAFLQDWRVSNNQVTDAQRAFEYISLSQPFSADRSIIRFNNIIETDFVGYVDPNTGNPVLGGLNNGKLAEWALSKTTFSEINSRSLWFAEQSEFFNGRLHTLIGLRFDHIKINSSLRKVSFDGYDPGFDDGRNNDASVTYEKLNPTVGGLFWVSDEIGIFANYAQSIESPSGTERTPIAEMAPPELGEGIEFGVRFDLLGGKLDGQLAYYSITKENDNEFNYSTALLNQIYPGSIYGAEFPENYYDLKNESGEVIKPNEGYMIAANLAGRRGVGDKTRSEGIELDFTYNPLPGLSFIGSYNFSVANEILELHPLVSNPENFELFGRPDHRATFTGRYKFRDGVLKGLTIGASQRYRSASNQTRFDLHYDANGDPVGDPNNIVTPVVRTDRVYLNFGDEHTTSAFATWEKKLGNKRSAPKLTLAFRVNNLFDNTDFSGRENYGFYRESRSYNLSGRIQF
jgi:outer membrane receptor protein involved in Fe transport